jgi:Pvc16 N-terminal domain
MANVFAIHSVGDSLATFLQNTYPAMLAGQAMPTCQFAAISSGELAADTDETGTRVLLYIYRITVNEHSRQARPPTRPHAQQASLGLDLHFLLFPWANTAQDELVTFGWAMRQLHQYPLLDASSLSPQAGWSTDEIVHIVPAELPVDEIMRIWDAIEKPYRLSTSYVARVVRLDPDTSIDSRPVVATRFGYGIAEAVT